MHSKTLYLQQVSKTYLNSFIKIKHGFLSENSAQLPPFVRGQLKLWLLHQVLAHEASAWAVCRCKTVFRLIGPYQALEQCQ